MLPLKILFDRYDYYRYAYHCINYTTFPFSYISMKKYKGYSLKRSLNLMSWAFFYPWILSFMVLSVMFS